MTHHFGGTVAHSRRIDDSKQTLPTEAAGDPGDAPVLPERSRAPWSTTVTYLIALLIIATISLSAEFVTQKIIARQEITALMVNTAGRQRMLSQRITRIADEVADGSRDRTAGRAEILVLAGRMEAAQRQLVDGDISHGMLPATSPGLRAIYFGAPIHLEQQVKTFLAHARSFAAQPTPGMGDPDLMALRQAVTAPLLNGLDAAVSEYQAASEQDVHHLRNVMSTLTCLMLTVLLLEALLIYRPLFNRLTGTISLLLKASTTDFLTGAMNRRAFLTAAERATFKARQLHQPLCLLMADIDHFKCINDTYGHPTGDKVIRHFALCVEGSLRKTDCVGRVGGEEFAILLPGTTLHGGMLVAERIRERFASTTAAMTQSEQPVSATVSIGMVCVSAGTLEDMFLQADQLLYKAKNSGRNRVEASRGDLSSVPDWVREGVQPA